MIRFVLAFVFVLGSACYCQSEFYRYTDENGNVIFTDDLTKVPAAQRANVKKYKTPEDNSPPQATTEGNTGLVNTKPVPDQINAAEQIKAERQKLLEREKKLKEQFAALEAERKQLIEQRKQAKSEEKINELNAGINAYNAKIKEYEERQKTFAQDVKAFNAKLKSLVEAQAEKVKKAQP